LSLLWYNLCVGRLNISTSKPIHVAVAVIINEQQQVLITLRQSHQHQGDLWEFPGGKVEADETIYEALVREIDEEIGLKITSATPFIIIDHDYGDKLVVLNVWLVDSSQGIEKGQEGQSLRWCAINDLVDDDFPAANVDIIKALKLRVK